MKSKIKGMFMRVNKSSFGCRANYVNVDEWEVRPGGMLVQKRDSDTNQNSVSVPVIKVRVKYGSSYHVISISSQASFGELKKMLAEVTGLHPQDQKLIYKKKERDSKAYLDVAKVKDGSKIVLIEDISSREKRCLEMIKSANIEKALKSLHQISLEVDNLARKVTTLEVKAGGGGEAAELEVDNLTEILMTKLVELDGIFVGGDLKLRKRTQEKRVQKYIETLDMLKLQSSTANSNGTKIPLLQKENSIGKMPIPMQKQQVGPKQKDAAVQMPMQQQSLRHTESFVITTKWETFD